MSSRRSMVLKNGSPKSLSYLTRNLSISPSVVRRVHRRRQNDSAAKNIHRRRERSYNIFSSPALASTVAPFLAVSTGRDK
jgi:hypothetical protein